jgi:hypothetical protein
LSGEKGIKEQGLKFEDYIEKEDPNLIRLKDRSKIFALSNPITKEAISAKTLNTLTVSRIKNPQSI